MEEGYWDSRSWTIILRIILCSNKVLKEWIEWNPCQKGYGSSCRISLGRNCIIGMSEGYGHGLVIDPNETGVARTWGASYNFYKLHCSMLLTPLLSLLTAHRSLLKAKDSLTLWLTPVRCDCLTEHHIYRTKNLTLYTMIAMRYWNFLFLSLTVGSIN